MFIRWKKKTLSSRIQRGSAPCFHDPDPVVTLTPILLHSVREPGRAPRHVMIWRPAPRIRECCLGELMVRAAWWREVEARFDALAGGEELPPDLAEVVVGHADWLVRELARKVRQPTARQMADFERVWSKAHQAAPGTRRGRRARPEGRPAAHQEDPFAVLGLAWPCGEDDLRKAWRRLAFEHHPDRGGDHDMFVRMVTAREACERQIRGVA